ncbi:hypothetical protein FA13DRAFT_1626964 [Coprinellus micaceus]|uniref:2OGFeDO JBP1/TET oxygenase domain-containing protein n=1 Tax=Coprinellus micaceus TaxID=71717 RepID=A0A4Y7THU6_COPMI|nr:hypothetical protein FA13DRAFT_1626964 [Coprinellus micaceus]
MIVGLFEGSTTPGWRDAIAETERCLRAARGVALETGAYGLPPFEGERRGAFVAIPVGNSTGGGQQRPGPLFHHIKMRRIIGKSIVRNVAMRRVCGAQSATFAFFAPKMFSHYTKYVGALYDSQPELVANFDNSIFTAASFNCGPQTVSLDHFDHNNLSYGPCALTPLGTYDYKKGGHLILFDLKLVIEFPPGTIALIPSAAVRHGNTPIGPDEDRMSIAQYCAGGIFRWVAYGHKTGASLDSTKAGRQKKQELNGGHDERWIEGLDLYSTVDSWTQDLAMLM